MLGLVGIQELLELFVRGVQRGIVRGEVHVVQRLGAGQFQQGRRVEAVTAQDGGVDTQSAGLLDDQADFLVVTGDVDHVKALALDVGQNRVEVLVARYIELFVHDVAAGGSEDLLEVLGQALGVVRGLVPHDYRVLGFQFLGRVVRHNPALIGIREAGAEGVFLQFSVGHRDVVGGGRT